MFRFSIILETSSGVIQCCWWPVWCRVSFVLPHWSLLKKCGSHIGISNESEIGVPWNFCGIYGKNYLETVVARECLIAFTAFVYSTIIMGAFMIGKVTGTDECSIAYRAIMRFFSRMCSLMDRRCFESCKGFATNVAHIWPLSWMSPFMHC